MSGQHRKVSRSILDGSSGFVTSRSHLTQPENELKQKLDAIDSSIKISNKKINNETRELKQILYDLQRDLKVSKSVSHYVPSPIEEQETRQVKRVRRVTVATAPRELRLDREIFPKSSTNDVKTAEDGTEVPRGVSTKRRRKTSVPPSYTDKILVGEGEVFHKERQVLADTLSKEKILGLEEKGVGSLENKGLFDSVGSVNYEQQVEQTNQCKHTSYGDAGAQDSAQPLCLRQQVSDELPQEKPTSLSSNFSMNNNQNLLTNTGDISTKPSLPSLKGIPSLYPPEEWSSNMEISTRNSSGISGGVASYSKYLSQERRRSLSESESINRETFKGKFVTNSLSQSDQVQSVLPPTDSQKRTRRITVAGIHPGCTRRRLDIGEIPVTPFQGGSRRVSVNAAHEDRRKKSMSLGRGPTGGLPLGKESDPEDMGSSLSPARDTQRYRRTSVRKVSSLPPLKEELTMQKAAKKPAVSNEWKNLENCRYLRKDDYEISIEDVFKKD